MLEDLLGRRDGAVYTETVEKRGYGLCDFVGLVSANAAKIMGRYPRKGALVARSDADIVLLDPRHRRIVRAAELHEADYTRGKAATSPPGRRS